LATLPGYISNADGVPAATDSGVLSGACFEWMAELVTEEVAVDRFERGASN
jgi:hypothetical protein